MSITTEEKIGYLVLNTGADAPTVPALRSYLKELSDPGMLENILQGQTI